jgi:hypothetical protein
MARKRRVSEYADRTMTAEQLAQARYETEQWANRMFAVRNPELYADITHMCTLAQGMWYKTARDEV